MREEIERFVASLAIPADRKAVVLAELLDHVSCAREAAAREGGDADAAARAALGNLEALRRSLEAVEPGFRVGRAAAFGRGVLASLVVAVAIDQGGAAMQGLLGALVALAVTVALAPPRLVELLRAELRAPRIAGAFGVAGPPIGPALVYLLTVLSGPYLVWIGLIVERAYGGMLRLDVPPSAFTVLVAIYALILVEGVRARRRAAA